MNKMKKEIINRKKMQRRGLHEAEILLLDFKEYLDQQIDNKARRIHAVRFSEEYDFMYDSSWDASERNNGKNPLSEEYQIKINEKRKAEKVTPLSKNGIAEYDDSMCLCRKQAEKEICEAVDISMFYALLCERFNDKKLIE